MKGCGKGAGTKVICTKEERFRGEAGGMTVIRRSRTTKLGLRKAQSAQAVAKNQRGKLRGLRSHGASGTGKAAEEKKRTKLASLRQQEGRSDENKRGGSVRKS